MTDRLHGHWVLQGQDSIQLVSLPPFAASTSIALAGPSSPFGERLVVVAPDGPMGGDVRARTLSA